MAEGVVIVAKVDLDRCFWAFPILVRAAVAVLSDADGARLVVDGEDGDGDSSAVELFESLCVRRWTGRLVVFLHSVLVLRSEYQEMILAGFGELGCLSNE
jgi:hypothetical protein